LDCTHFDWLAILIGQPTGKHLNSLSHIILYCSIFSCLWVGLRNQLTLYVEDEHS
jgi:hypothetical protein